MTAAALPPAAIDLGRYPIHDLDAPAGAALVARCRAELSRSGACLLPGFLHPAATAAIAREAEACGARAHRIDHHFPFGDGTSEDRPDLARLAADDPRRYLSRTALRFVAYDEIPAASALRAVYEWDGMLAFVAAALGRGRLYRPRRRLGPLNYTVMAAGDEQAWHFDNNDFTVTILLQAPEGGGRFEYVPGLRSAAGDDVAGLGRALAGRHERLTRLALAPGTLSLFEGRYAFHRATPVEGGRLRLLAVLSYEEEPDIPADRELCELLYGRSE